MPVGNPGDLYGPFLIGLIFCCVLYGITVAQSIFYFRTYKLDARYLKILVGFCMIMDTVHIGLVCETLHYWYVVCRLPENYDGLPVFRLSFGSSVCVTYVVTSVVQIFYIMRVYALSKNKWIVITISSLSCIQLVGGLVLTVDLFIDARIAAVHGRVSQIGGGIELVATTSCDLLISGALVYYLNHSRTGIRGTENVINRLIIFSVNIGLITSIVALCNLVFWLALPTNFIFAAFHIILSKFYINSMLVTLNSRNAVREQLRSPLGISISGIEDSSANGFILSTFNVDRPIGRRSAPKPELSIPNHNRYAEAADPDNHGEITTRHD